MSPPAHISRREAIQRLTVLAGGAMSSSTLAAVFAGCEATPAPAGWTPVVLTRPQLEVLTAVVDEIIPATETPGARDVGVPRFVDTLLERYADEDERTRVLDGLDELGPEFLALNNEEQAALLVVLDQEAVTAREADTEPLPYFATLKEWTLVGYYTSEVGATEELRWMPVPGRWDGDVPLDDVGRTWA